MTATKGISDRFKVSSLLLERLKEHHLSVPAVLDVKCRFSIDMASLKSE